MGSFLGRSTFKDGDGIESHCSQSPETEAKCRRPNSPDLSEGIAKSRDYARRDCLGTGRRRRVTSRRGIAREREALAARLGVGKRPVRSDSIGSGLGMMGSPACRSGLGPQKAELIRIVLHLLIDAHARGMAAGHTVVQQNRSAAG